MSFIFSATSNLNDSKYGALEMPIKMLIEAESDLAQKKTGALTALFNIEKSNRYAEGIQYQDRFGGFTYAAEGSAAETEKTAQARTTLKATTTAMIFLIAFIVLTPFLLYFFKFIAVLYIIIIKNKQRTGNI